MFLEKNTQRQVKQAMFISIGLTLIINVPEKDLIFDDSSLCLMLHDLRMC